MWKWAHSMYGTHGCGHLKTIAQYSLIKIIIAIIKMIVCQTVLTIYMNFVVWENCPEYMQNRLAVIENKSYGVGGRVWPLAQLLGCAGSFFCSNHLRTRRLRWWFLCSKQSKRIDSFYHRAIITITSSLLTFVSVWTHLYCVPVRTDLNLDCRILVDKIFVHVNNNYYSNRNSPSTVL